MVTSAKFTNDEKASLALAFLLSHFLQKSRPLRVSISSRTSTTSAETARLAKSAKAISHTADSMHG